MTFTLETADLTGVGWDKLHAVVLADYRPAGSSGPFDTLQAIRASGAGLADAIAAVQVMAGVTPSRDINKDVDVKGDRRDRPAGSNLHPAGGGRDEIKGDQEYFPDFSAHYGHTREI